MTTNHRHELTTLWATIDGGNPIKVAKMYQRVSKGELYFGIGHDGQVRSLISFIGTGEPTASPECKYIRVSWYLMGINPAV